MPRFPALLACLFATAAHAELTHLEISSRQPYGTFSAGDYVLLKGKVHGELSPLEAIPGLDKAARNARGRVEYSAAIVLVIPAEPRRGNGTLLVDIPNRGRGYAHAIYNAPRGDVFPSGTFEQGTGFLQDRGYSVAVVQWELGMDAQLPSFTDADGKTRYVEGAGFAIVRDAADFLAHGATDATGTRNPLAGAVKRTIAAGKSQSGRFLKTFLLRGFNQAAGRRVLDGVQVVASAAGQLPIMQVGTGPESSANGIPTFDDPEFPGENVEPQSIEELMAAIASRGEAPPKAMFVNTTTDYYSRRASVGRTGTTGAADRALPANVRAYDLAGAPHVLVSRAPATCTLPQGRLDWSPVARATLARLNAWIADGTEPPASVLMPLEPAPGNPPALRAPAAWPTAVIQVPKLDADGNALGGVRLPDLAVPMGTHGPQNKPTSRDCMLLGSYAAFAATKAQRETAGDARLSIAERYRDRDDYVNRIRGAVRELAQQGFLLPEDAAVIVESAASTKAFAHPRAERARANDPETTGKP